MTGIKTGLAVGVSEEGVVLVLGDPDAEGVAQFLLSAEQARATGQALGRAADRFEYASQGGDLAEQGESGDAPCASAGELREAFDRTFAKD